MAKRFIASAIVLIICLVGLIACTSCGISIKIDGPSFSSSEETTVEKETLPPVVINVPTNSVADELNTKVGYTGPSVEEYMNSEEGQAIINRKKDKVNERELNANKQGIYNINK